MMIPWRPVKFTYTPDNMPTLQIRLAISWKRFKKKYQLFRMQAPPSKPLPEVNAVVSQMDAEWSRFEKVPATLSSDLRITLGRMIASRSR